MDLQNRVRKVYGSRAQGKEEAEKGGQLGVELHSCLISAGQGLEGAGRGLVGGQLPEMGCGNSSSLASG